MDALHVHSKNKKQSKKNKANTQNIGSMEKNSHADNSITFTKQEDGRVEFRVPMPADYIGSHHTDIHHTGSHHTGNNKDNNNSKSGKDKKKKGKKNFLGPDPREKPRVGLKASTFQTIANVFARANTTVLDVGGENRDRDDNEKSRQEIGDQDPTLQALQVEIAAVQAHQSARQRELALEVQLAAVHARQSARQSARQREFSRGA